MIPKKKQILPKKDLLAQLIDTTLGGKEQCTEDPSYPWLSESVAEKANDATELSAETMQMAKSQTIEQTTINVEVESLVPIVHEKCANKKKEEASHVVVPTKAGASKTVYIIRKSSNVSQQKFVLSASGKTLNKSGKNGNELYMGNLSPIVPPKEHSPVKSVSVAESELLSSNSVKNKETVVEIHSEKTVLHPDKVDISGPTKVSPGPEQQQTSISPKKTTDTLISLPMVQSSYTLESPNVSSRKSDMKPAFPLKKSAWSYLDDDSDEFLSTLEFTDILQSPSRLDGSDNDATDGSNAKNPLSRIHGISNSYLPKTPSYLIDVKNIKQISNSKSGDVVSDTANTNLLDSPSLKIDFNLQSGKTSTPPSTPAEKSPSNLDELNTPKLRHHISNSHTPVRPVEANAYPNLQVTSDCSPQLSTPKTSNSSEKNNDYCSPLLTTPTVSAPSPIATFISPPSRKRYVDFDDAEEITPPKSNPNSAYSCLSHNDIFGLWPGLPTSLSPENIEDVDIDSDAELPDITISSNEKSPLQLSHPAASPRRLFTDNDDSEPTSSLALPIVSAATVKNEVSSKLLIKSLSPTIAKKKSPTSKRESYKHTKRKSDKTIGPSSHKSKPKETVSLLHNKYKKTDPLLSCTSEEDSLLPHNSKATDSCFLNESRYKSSLSPNKSKDTHNLLPHQTKDMKTILSHEKSKPDSLVSNQSKVNDALLLHDSETDSLQHPVSNESVSRTDVSIAESVSSVKNSESPFKKKLKLAVSFDDGSVPLEFSLDSLQKKNDVQSYTSWENTSGNTKASHYEEKPPANYSNEQSSVASSESSLGNITAGSDSSKCTLLSTSLSTFCSMPLPTHLPTPLPLPRPYISSTPVDCSPVPLREAGTAAPFKELFSDDEFDDGCLSLSDGDKHVLSDDAAPPSNAFAKHHRHSSTATSVASKKSKSKKKRKNKDVKFSDRHETAGPGDEQGIKLKINLKGMTSETVTPETKKERKYKEKSKKRKYKQELIEPPELDLSTPKRSLLPSNTFLQSLETPPIFDLNNSSEVCTDIVKLMSSGSKVIRSPPHNTESNSSYISNYVDNKKKKKSKLSKKSTASNKSIMDFLVDTSVAKKHREHIEPTSIKIGKTSFSIICKEESLDRSFADDQEQVNNSSKLQWSPKQETSDKIPKLEETSTTEKPYEADVISPREWHGRGAKLRAQILITDTHYKPPNSKNKCQHKVKSPLTHDSHKDVLSPNAVDESLVVNTDEHAESSITGDTHPTKEALIVEKAEDRTWHSRSAKLKAQIIITDQTKQGNASLSSSRISYPNDSSSLYSSSDIRKFFSPKNTTEGSPVADIQPAECKTTPKGKSCKADIRSFFLPKTLNETHSTDLPQPNPSSKKRTIEESEETADINNMKRFRDITPIMDIPVADLKRAYEQRINEQAVVTVAFLAEEATFEGFDEHTPMFSSTRAQGLRQLAAWLNISQMSKKPSDLPLPADMLFDWDEEQLVARLNFDCDRSQPI